LDLINQDLGDSQEMMDRLPMGPDSEMDLKVNNILDNDLRDLQDELADED